MAQDKRDQLYDNLINSGKVSEEEIGTREDFKNAITDEQSSREFYKNLSSSGIFSEEEIGNEDDFFGSISDDFTRKPTTAETLQKSLKERTYPTGEVPQPRKVETQPQEESQGGYTPSAEEMASFRQTLSDASNAVGNTKNFDRKAENIQKHQGIHIPKRTVVGETGNLQERQELNPETGEMETTYITERGNEYRSKAVADQEQREVDAVQQQQRWNKEHPKEALLSNLNEQEKNIDELLGKQEIDWVDADGRIHYKGGRGGDEAVNNLKIAKQDIEEARTRLERSEQLEASSDFLGGIGLPFTKDWFNNWKNFGYGVWDTLKTPSLYDFGKSDLEKAGAYVRIKDKMERGEELSDQETALALAGMSMAHAQEIAEIPHGYTAGVTTTEMAPFMLQMALNPAGGFGRAFATKAVRQFGKEGIKAVSARIAARVIGNVGEAAVLSNTLQAPATIANIMERNTGDSFEYDEDGKLRIGHYEKDENGKDVFVEGGKGLARSVWEGEASSIIENFTELGTGGSINRFLGKVAASNMGQRIGLGYISDLVGKVGATPFARNMKRFMERTHWDGMIEEPLEEEYGIILNSLLTGDNQISDLWDSEQQTDIFAGTMWFGGFMAGMNTAAYPFYKRNIKKQLQQADFMGSEAFGEEWPVLKDNIEEMADKDIASYLYDIKDNEAFSNDQKAALFAYASRLKQSQGANVADMLMRMEGNLSQEEVSLRDAYSKGQELEEPQDMNDAQTRMEMLREQVGEFIPEDILEDMDNNPINSISIINRMATFTPEEKQQAIDYVNARFTYQGMVDKVNDDIESKIAVSDATIDRQLNRDDSMLHPATLNDDSKVYIIGGHIVMLDDGTGVNRQASKDANGGDGMILTVNAETGKLESHSVEDFLTVDEPINGEVMKEEARQTIIATMSQEADNKIDGILSFQPGEEYTVTDGEGLEHQVQIFEDQGDGNVVVYMDGSLQPEVMDKQTIQQMADNYNAARLQQEMPAREEKPEERIAQEEEKKPETAMSRIPVITDAQGQPVLDKKGQPQYKWHEASVEDTSGALIEQTDGNLLMARDTANAMVAKAKKDKENIKKSKATGNDPLSIIESKKANEAAEQQAQSIIKHWQNVAHDIQRRMDEESARVEAERKAALTEQQRKEEEEKQRLQQERIDEADRKRLREQIERDREKRNKEYEGITRARRELASDSEASAILDDLEPRSLDEWVSSMLRPHSLLWKDASDTERGLQSELGLNREDMQRMMSVLGTKESGAKPFGQVVLDIYEGLTPAMKEQYSDEDVRNTLLQLFNEGNSGRMLHLTEEHRIEEANEMMKENRRREAEAEMDAWSEAYHLEPEERATFEEFLESAASPIEQEVINNIIAEYEETRTIQAMAQQPDNGADAAGIEGGEAEVQGPQGREGSNTLAQQPQGEGSETGSDKPSASDDSLDGEEQKLKQRISVLEDEETTENGVYGTIYHRPIVVDGQYRLEQIDEPDEKGNYTGSYYTYKNERFGDLYDAVHYLDSLVDVDITKTHKMQDDLVKAYTAGDAKAIKKAANAIYKYIEKGGDFEGHYEESIDDYTGNEPEMLAKQYILHALLDRNLDDDEDQDFIKTGLRKDIRESMKGKKVESKYKKGDIVLYENYELKVSDINEDGTLQLSGNASAINVSLMNMDPNSVRTPGSKESMDYYYGKFMDNLKENKFSRDLATEMLEKVDERLDRLRSSIDEKNVNSTDAENLARLVSQRQAVSDYIDSMPKTSSAKEIKSEEKKVDTNPTEAQKEAGNYKKGHIKLDGYDVSIENPKGSVRRGTDANGRQWESKMYNTYGYIRGTEGVDGDHIDVYLSDDPTSGSVFVVDQVDPKSKKFDEHKVMYGFSTMEEARKAYLSNYEEGWQGLGTITEVSREEFKKWVDSSHRKTKPFAQYKSVKAEAAQSEKKTQPKNNDELVKAGTILKNNRAGGDAVVKVVGSSIDVNTGERQYLVEYYTSEEDVEGRVVLGDDTIGQDVMSQRLNDGEFAKITKKKTKKSKQEPKRLVSDDRMEELKKRLREKLGGQANIGVDPEILALGAEMAVGYIERGITKFADYAKVMLEEVGDFMRPYLKSFYNAVRDMPEAQDYAQQMDDYQTVSSFDVANLGKEKPADVFEKAEQVANEEKVKRQTKKIKKEQPDLFAGTLFAEQEPKEEPKEEPKDKAEPQPQEKKPAERKLRPAIEADFDEQNPVVYYEGRPYNVIAITHKGEQISATEFSKPHISSVMLTNGKSVKLEQLQVEYEGTIPNNPWWQDVTRPKLDSSDYKTYVTDEAKEYFANYVSADGKVDFTKWAHPNLAYITAAAWDGADIPEEELKKIPEIIEAEKALREGSLTISDEEKEQLAQRLLDSHKGEVRQERKAYFIIGRPAGGKSSVFANPISRNNYARIVDADEVKPWLEGYDGGNGAGYVQDASDSVMQRAMEIAALNGDNLVLPKIGGGSVAEMSAALRLIGYDVQLYYNDVAPETSYMRSSSRFAQTGRYLSLNYLTGIKDKPTKFFSNFAEKSIGDYINERTEDEIQKLQGRLARLHSELYGSGEGLRLFRAAKREGEGTSDGTVQSSLGSQGVQIGGNEVSALEPIYSYAEWKSNDVAFGETPKDIWNTNSGKSLSELLNNNNNGSERTLSAEPQRGSQEDRQGGERPDGSREELGTEQDRAERSRSRHSVGNSTLTLNNNKRNNTGERGKDYAPTSPKARYNANVAAIKLMRQLIENDVEAPSKEEMAVLRQYSGWGGLGTFFNDESTQENKELHELLSEEEYNAAVMSINSAYFTPATVIDSMWDIAKSMGFEGGSVLEGSAGIGNIIGQMPKDLSRRSTIEAVEIDKTSGNILKLLYPDAKVDIQGFQDTKIPNGSVDLAITNVPFVTGLHVFDKIDKDLSRRFVNIHDFCIAKNIRKLREGGIGIFITSSGTLDKSTDLRSWITDEGQADVVGAFRLNNETFGGTTATSDIIVVRKRINGQKSPAAIDISKASPLRVGDWTDKYGEEHHTNMTINDYFKEHPEMMAGEMAFAYEKGETFRPGSYGLYPAKGKDQAKMLKNFAKSMEQAAEVQTQPTEQAEVITNQLTAVKEGRMLIDDNGRLCVSQYGTAVPLGLNDNKVKGQTKQQCFKDYQAVQAAVDDVLQQQLNDPDDAKLQPKLDKLNKVYDAFVKRYGNLHKNTAISFLRNDIDFPSFQALENYSETKDINGKVNVSTSKTPLFHERVLGFKTEPQPKNIKDAVTASLFKSNNIDLEWIADKLGKTVDEVRNEILNERVGFEDPTTGQLEIRYKYLSGNVREKLAAAEAYNQDGKYNTNVEELRKVIPMDIPAHLIDFSLGSSWIPMEIYNDYLKEILDLHSATLTHVGGTWSLDEGSFKNEKNRAAGVYSEKFNTTIYGHELVAAALNNRPVKVAKQVTEGWGSSKTTRTIVDQQATQACAVRVDEIKDEFKQFAKKKMQDDTELAARVEKIYNEKFNALVPMDIDKEFMPEHFEGANMNISLYDHQKKGVMRGLTAPTMLAHEVGTGKSFTLISTAMEMRRLGTAKKPMIVVQNATVAQLTADTKLLYPNAKVLSLTERDRDAEGRRAFYAKIKYNDWDIIIVPQSTFERIPDSPARELQFIQEKIDEKKHVIEAAMAAGASQRDLNRLKKELESIEQEYGDKYLDGGEESMNFTKKRKKDAKKEAASLDKAETKAREQLDRAVDDVQYFDDLGVDAILVDEAHEYKHLGFQTSIGRGIKGIDPSYSKKCAGLYNKTRVVFEKAGWKNVVFATGTPISNTAAEIWTFMKYLMPADVMKANDIYYFDDFVHNFGSIAQSLEFQTNGKFREVTRFSAYVNKPELIRIWGQVADTVLTKEVGKVQDKIPEQEGGKDNDTDIFLPQSPSLISIMAAVRAELDRFEKMDGKEKKENSSIPLTMYGIAKRAAIDPRLVNPDAPDEAMSKTNAAVKEIIKDLNDTKSYKGTVAVFCDNQNRLGYNAAGKKVVEFNIFEEMREKLISQGVPAGQIAIIKSGMSITAKQKIFDAVNTGDIRVIMGSTQTLGTGVNIQERLHCLIHMDAPDRPMDYTQRNGRIKRQGNLHKEWGKTIRVLRFGVEDSLDVTAYQRLKTKAGFIDSIMNGKAALLNNQVDRTVEEEEEGLFDNPVAVLSGSQYALKKNQAERELRKYQGKKAQWEADQVYVTNRLRHNKHWLATCDDNIKENTEALDHIKSLFPDGTAKTIIVEGVTIDMTGKDAEKQLSAAIKEKINDPSNAIVKRNRENPIYNDEVLDYTITLDGHDVNFKVEVTRESVWDSGRMRTVIHKLSSYSSPDLRDRTSSTAKSVSDLLQIIREEVITGKDYQDRIEAYKADIEKTNEENEQLQKRVGLEFQFGKELEEARKNVEEYTELMRQEMEEKEAKYASQQTEAVDLNKAESEEDDDLYRDDDEEPVFYSNAMNAVRNIRQEKATPSQWLAMIEKNGGLKAGEDKWLGLSDWLLSSDKRTLSKDEVMSFIRQNEIQVDEVQYKEGGEYHNELKKKYPTFDEAFVEAGEDYFGGPEIEIKDLQKAIDFYNEYAKPQEKWDNSVMLSYDEEEEIKRFAASIVTNSADKAVVRPINETRMRYTTEGLQNYREIAMTVPTIESWNENDEIHFGDAGEGRAVAWIRFGDKIIPDPALSERRKETEKTFYDYLDEMSDKYETNPDEPGSAYDKMTAEEKEKGERLNQQRIKAIEEEDNSSKKVLVIDEIQSKRHQEGRERGYGSKGIPDAPFDKNWHELAMKRMLRYAAENGYEEIAWTTGEQQAQRYSLSQVVDSIEVSRWGEDINGNYIDIEQGYKGPSSYVPKDDVEKSIKEYIEYCMSNGDTFSMSVGYAHNQISDAPNESVGWTHEAVNKVADATEEELTGSKDARAILIDIKGGDLMDLTINKEGVVLDSSEIEFKGKPLSDIVGKENAIKIIGMESNGKISPEGLSLGGEGMKGFYDEMLPRFMNKYGKKWGVKVSRTKLEGLDGTGRTMWSIDVTPEMQESVMQGQPLFRDAEEENPLIERVKAALEEKYHGFNDAFLIETDFVTLQPQVWVEDSQKAIELFTKNNDIEGINPDDYYFKAGRWGKRVFTEMMKDPSLQEEAEEKPDFALKAEQKREEIINSDNFKNYFGDWEKSPETASKVVDKDGKPAIMYHGTNLTQVNNGEAFWQFYPDSHFGTVGQAKSVIRVKGIQKTYPVYLNIRNPKRVSDVPAEWEDAHSEYWYRQIQRAKAEGYDGIVYTNMYEDKKHPADSWIAFYPEQVKSATDNNGSFDANNADIRYRLRENEPPTNTGIGYKVFVVKEGKLYPPMVANPNGASTPVNEWLDADAAPIAGTSKTGRPQVKAGGKGTQGGSGQLAYRPGWHLGTIPYAIQFNRKDAEGNKTLFPKNFVWAEVEYANDIDYQQEAYQAGINDNGKYQHSLAGLKHLPVDGSYRYRTNPNPETDEWIITGAMKVNRLLKPSEVDELVRQAGREPQQREEGAITDADIEVLNDVIENRNNLREGSAAMPIHDRRTPREQRSSLSFAERQIRRAKEQAQRTIIQLGLEDKVTILDNADEMGGRKAKAKGWYNKETDKIYIVIGNHRRPEDVVITILHEGVAHYGLRKLFGKNFEQFLKNVYESGDLSVKMGINDMIARLRAKDRKAGRKLRSTEEYKMVATEEYLARLAEDTDFERAVDQGWWQRIKEAFLNMLKRVGLSSFDGELSDNELRYILWRSYQNLTNPARYRNVFDEAADIAKQVKLNVGRYAKERERIQRLGRTDTSKYAAEVSIPKPKKRPSRLLKDLKDEFKKLDDMMKDEQGRDFDQQEEDVRYSYIRENGVEGLGKVMAKFMDDAIAKFGEKNITRRWDLMEEITDLEEQMQNNSDLYREIDEEPLEPNDVARRIYEEAVKDTGDRSMLSAALWAVLHKKEGWERFKHKFAESHFDYTRSIKALQDAIAAVSGKVAESFEDVWKSLNAKSSIDNVEIKDAMQRYIVPLSEHVARMIKGKKLHGKDITLDDVEKYMNAVHGIERNVSMAMKQAKDEYEEDIAILKKQLENTALTDDERTSIEEILLRKEARFYGIKNYMGYPSVAKWYNQWRQSLERARQNNTISEDDYNKANERMDAEYNQGWQYKYREKDFAGLTALFADELREKEDEVTEDLLEQAARDYADEFAQAVGIDEVTRMWQLVKDLNNFSLRKSYLSGLISKSQYDDTLQMYEHYVPLRGWHDDYAGDVYQYISRGEPAEVLQGVLRKAYGRKSRAARIFGTMAAMANSAIVQGNKNMVAQKLLNLAMRNTDAGLLMVTEQYYSKDANENLVPLFPDLQDGMTAEQMQEEIERFEADMKEKQEQGEVEPLRKKFGKEFPLRMAKWQEQRHAVRVLRNGKEYMVYVLGNPRAAEAFNGMLNPNATPGNLTNKLSKYMRFRAKWQTSLSPEFLLSNFQRDVLTASTGAYVKFGKEAQKMFAKNLAKVMPFTAIADFRKGNIENAAGIFSLLKKYDEGTLDKSKDMERWFDEFIRNGGMTGISYITRSEEYQASMEDVVKRMRQGKLAKPRQWSEAVGEAIEFANKGIENATRFAMYMTSRQQGKSIVDSVFDAKEASVNFNMKGSGAWGNLWARRLYLYVNPAMQALRMLGTWWDNDPMVATRAGGRMVMRSMGKRFTIAAIYTLMASLTTGMLNVLISALLGHGDGDDDKDSSDWWAMSEWNRYNFVNIVNPFGKGYFHWSLPQEIRPLWAIGQIAIDLSAGKVTSQHAFNSMLSQLNNLSPLAFFEGGTTADDSTVSSLIRTFTPTFVAEVADAYGWNRDFMGRPITNQQEWNKNAPEWQRALESTPKAIVEASKQWNELTGGRENHPSWFDGRWANPSALYYIFTQQYGGMGTMAKRMYSLIEQAFDPEQDMELRNVPFIPKLYISTGDDYSKYRMLNEKFRLYWNEFKSADYELKEDRKKVASGEMEQEKADKTIEERKADGSYHTWEVIDHNNLDNIYSKVRGDREKAQEVKRMIVEAIEEGKTPDYEKLSQGAANEMERKMWESARTKQVSSKYGDMAGDELQKAFDASDNAAERKEMAKRISKQLGADKDPYGDKPTSDYERLYQELRTANDVYEDALLSAYQKRANENGDYELADEISKARREIRAYAQGLEEGYDNESVMNDIRQERSMVISQYNLR